MYLATKWNFHRMLGWAEYDQRVFETFEEAEDFITSYGNGKFFYKLTVRMHVRESGELYAIIEVDVPPHGVFRCSCPAVVYRYIGNTGDVGTITWEAP